MVIQRGEKHPVTACKCTSLTGEQGVVLGTVFLALAELDKDAEDSEAHRLIAQLADELLEKLRFEDLLMSVTGLTKIAGCHIPLAETRASLVGQRSQSHGKAR